MRYQPERALKLHIPYHNSFLDQDVEMRYQPERALKLCLKHNTDVGRADCRNEISAREGIETRSAATA